MLLSLNALKSRNHFQLKCVTFSIMTDVMDATLRYARADSDALLHEKAYILNYETPPEIPKSNFIIDFFPGIKIHDLRTANLNYRENGLTISALSSCMPKEDFEQEEKIESVYLPDVHRCICETLDVKEVYIFDYMIRKREPSFPFQPKTWDNAAQPALSAHIGRPVSLLDMSEKTERSVQITRRMKSKGDCKSTSRRRQMSLDNDGFKSSSRLTYFSGLVATDDIQAYGNPLPVRCEITQWRIAMPKRWIPRPICWLWTRSFLLWQMKCTKCCTMRTTNGTLSQISWTQKSQSLLGMIRIKGKVFRYHTALLIWAMRAQGGQGRALKSEPSCFVMKIETCFWILPESIVCFSKFGLVVEEANGIIDCDESLPITDRRVRSTRRS